ncbi:serine/arginine-rich splicing factor 2b isoform X4 [Hippoglossus hippoglossus]|uniref:serine/arginine-rich splicing factor 2b isoform X4 n=1 Tax=Hippoglossus hippoglossus TaxID=8267 RepID=UPI00148CACEB|nr:serine/arginine-rich splicing factor 2b isoform X4 [Hippoglossus hippoglossus]
MSYGRPPPDVDGMTSLKVDNLTYRTSPETLRRVFEKYGRVGDVYIPRDRYTKESRGFAFVRFHDKRDAEDAMDAMEAAVAAEEVEVEEEDGEEERPGGAEVMAAEAEARDTRDAAGPAAGAALVPAADPAPADPAPTPDPSPTLPGPRPPSPSPILAPDQNPSQSPGPEAIPLPPKESLGPGLKASPSPQQKTEVKPRRALHISSSFR